MVSPDGKPHVSFLQALLSDNVTKHTVAIGADFGFTIGYWRRVSDENLLTHEA